MNDEHATAVAAEKSDLKAAHAGIRIAHCSIVYVTTKDH